MLIPSVNFVENNIGITPITPGVRNRIGIVGEFSRGPANVATYITGYTDFSTRYGSDTNKGSLAYQAAFDQGAEEFMAVRVLGRGKVSKGAVVFGGEVAKPNRLLMNLKFIGNVVDKGTIPMVSSAFTTGMYTGSVSGRYYFYVSTADSTNATIKWKFYRLGAEPTVIDWSEITDTLTINLTTDKGLEKEVENGLKVIFGTASQTDPLYLSVGNSFSVRCNSYLLETEINTGELPPQMITQFIDSVVGLYPLGNIVRDEFQTGAIFELEEDLIGSIGNKFYYWFELQDEVDSGVTVYPHGIEEALTFQGGEDQPRNAFRDFYTLSGIPLIRIIALSEGSWGNQLNVSIFPLNNKKFRLSIEDLNAENFNPRFEAESYIININEVDADGQLNQLSNSSLVRGFFIPKLNNPAGFDSSLLLQSPQRIAPINELIVDLEDPTHKDHFGINFLQNISLQNGYDGPGITDEDYINGLEVIKEQPAHIIICPGQYQSTNIRQAMISHAENASELEGLRIAVLNARPRLVPGAANQETVGLESTRAVMVSGWCSYSGQPNAPRFGTSPDAFYAGKLANTPFFAGPNSRRTAGSVQAVSECDASKFSSKNSLQIFTDAKLEILTLDPSTQSYVFTNGRTLSANIDWEKVSFRRTYDYIRQDLFDLLQQYKSEPHTNLLRTQIVTAINGYMNERARNSEIASYGGTIADSSNNTVESYIRGELNISVRFLPVYALDYINVILIRDSQTGLVSFGS
jgi:hypothetical protein